MNPTERDPSQASRHEAYFASQHSVQNLCEIVAQKDFAIVPSRKIASLLSAIEPDVLDKWAEFQQSWNRLEQSKVMTAALELCCTTFSRLAPYYA